MQNLLFLIPALPFTGFLVLALFGSRLSRKTIALIASGMVAVSLLIAAIMGIELVGRPDPDGTITQTLWQWMPLENFTASLSYLLDPLSLIMVLVITFVGFLIHVYSAEFMQGEEGYSRFFAYMNLFVSSMLTLVLADNLLLLYLGWEGVGLCSYLLIGFWYRDPANGRAARKAFIVTRVGDTAMILGLFLLVTNLHTLNIRDVMSAASGQWAPGSPEAVLAAALLLGGALGKSAQLPLQTWLPDAMAGPTPVSALIHAATMVTAGVYLIARTHILFLLAPPVLFAVAVIGAATLLVAGFSALVQKDIKRVLAYSTISQIGYMFLALGVGAWSSALFHFMTHAFFKALLFLGAGVVILAQHHEHDMFKMGGLRTRLPLVFWTFLVGVCSLSAIPFVTAGFYSKDLILWDAWASPLGGRWFWLAGVIGAFITTVYSFRMLFLVFFGESTASITYQPRWRMNVPLVLLAIGAATAGFVELPPLISDFRPFSEFLGSVLPQLHPADQPGTELKLLLATGAVTIAGVLLAYFFYVVKPQLPKLIVGSSPGNLLNGFWQAGWGFDAAYDFLFVRPFLWLAQLNRQDAIDSLYAGLARLNVALHLTLSVSQTGGLRWYALGMAAGAVIFLGIVILFGMYR